MWKWQKAMGSWERNESETKLGEMFKQMSKEFVRDKKESRE